MSLTHFLSDHAFDLHCTSCRLKQQDIKFAIAKLVKTEFYVLFDADTVCLDTTANALKACITYSDDMPHGVVRTAVKDSSHHAIVEGFQNNTAAVFDLPVDLTKIYKWLDYTPQILSTTVVRKIGDMLEKKDDRGRDWVEIISTTGRPGDPKFSRTNSGKGVYWTEFMLYQLGAMTLDLWNEYHIEEERCDAGAAISECECNIRSYVWDTNSLESLIASNKEGSSPPVIFITIADDVFANNPDELKKARALLGMNW